MRDGSVNLHYLFLLSKRNKHLTSHLQDLGVLGKNMTAQEGGGRYVHMIMCYNQS